MGEGKKKDTTKISDQDDGGLSANQKPPAWHFPATWTGRIIKRKVDVLVNLHRFWLLQHLFCDSAAQTRNTSFFFGNDDNKKQ